jgi:hypothetical protein
MKTRILALALVAFGVLSFPLQARAQVVFQAAGPTAASIEATVAAFRTALGDPDNGNGAGPLTSGRREINWDGGGSDVTTDPVTPFDGFLNTRGARFTTPGTGLSQAPPSGGPQGGLVGLFGNQTYGTIFVAFSPLRLFTPVGSRTTEGVFFIPGTNGGTPALVRGFGAVFTDVDQPDGEKKQGEHPTVIEYYDANDRLLFTGFVPSSPGDGSQSFFGVVFEEALIGRVRIKTGDSRPGRDDGGNQARDIVMMDNFIYGEPQPLP